jgi:ribosomal protein S18 acetylase RimI-like enzyme
MVMADESPAIIARPHAGRANLPALVDFASRSLLAHFPQEAEWHPGDIVWQLKDARDAHLDMRRWETSAGLVAAALFAGPGQLWLECLPDHEDLVVEALDWAEDAIRAHRPRLGDESLSVKLFEARADRVARVEAKGYRRSAPEGVRFRRALDRDIDPAPLPKGVRLRDCIDIDPQARAACHREAWNHLDHIGIENARSTFTYKTYARLLDSSVYDPSLDILAETAEGQFVAGCICWADEASGIGAFEPVGTHVDFRGQGLARAVNVEGLRRLKARGLRWGRVGTAHFNAPAIATYLSCGFEVIDRTALWTKPLD